MMIGDVFASTGGRVWDAGDDSPVLVFIHGSGQNHLGFQLQARFLANRGFRVLVPDMPAHFKTGGAALESVAAMADWYSGVLGAAGVSRAHIIGHSQGGLVALEWAARYPTQVQSLAIIASALAIPINAGLLDMARTDEPRAIAAMCDWGHGQVAHSHCHTVPGMVHVAYGRYLMGLNAAGALLADLSACAAYDGGEAAAGQVDCPCLCILAGADKMTPIAQGRLLAEALGAEVCEVAGAGHMLPSEHPVAVNRALRGFWDSC